MSASMNTMLILGATSGIGEAFARRFHAKGKKLILTGRREERLAQLQQELPGVETRVMDNTDLASLPKHVAAITKSYPDLDTVWINSGIQRKWDIKDPSSSSDQWIADEVTTNITAPFILARLFTPHLLSLEKEANLMMTSSGLAFVPFQYPVYCPTKAAIHSYMVVLRQQLKDTNVNVIELAPPYVSTDLDALHRSDNVNKPMPLDEYTESVFEILESNKATDLKEVAVGFAAMGAEAWRNSIGDILQKMKLGG